MGSIVFANFKNNVVRAVADLRNLCATWSPDAEAALSVERQYQNRFATTLKRHNIRSAGNRAIHRFYMSSLTDNTTMQRFARKLQAGLRFEYGKIPGEIIL